MRESHDVSRGLMDGWTVRADCERESHMTCLGDSWTGWTVRADCVRESHDVSRGLMDGMDSKGRL